VDEGFIFLNTPNIKGARIDFDDVNHITAERYYESPEIILRQGDVLIAKDGSTLGIANVVRSLPAPATVNSSIAVIRPAEKLTSVYCFYFLASHYTQSMIGRMKDGMGVPHLFQADLRKFTILLPPEADQAAIAEFLDRETARIDALIEKKERLITLLEEKRTALINRAVTKGLDPAAPMRNSGLAWLGAVPAHWQVKRIKWIATMESGHTPDKKVPAYWEDCEIPWVSLNDTAQLRIVDYVSETAFNVNALGIAHSSARMLPTNAVVFSRDATVGLCAIANRPMAVSQHFIAWICGPDLTPQYLLFILRSMTQELERLTMGATIKTIGMPDVRTLSTPVPPTDEQERIVAYILAKRNRLDISISKIREQIAKFHEYRTALISAAVTGKIDVRASPRRIGRV
jgi:type I restriction enzyme S subunit